MDEDLFSKIYTKGFPAGDSTLEKLVVALSSESKLYAKNSYASWGAMCPRRAVFKRAISPEQKVPMGAPSKFFFETGTSVHRVIQQAFYDAGILYGAEVRIEYNGIAGFIDVVFEDDDGATALVDIKTCGSRIPSWPKIEYVQQIYTYGLLTGIDRLYILYMSRSVMNFRGELQWRMIPIPFTRQEKINTALRLSWGIVGKKYNILPAKPKDLASPEDCGFCNFKKLCWPLVENPPVEEFVWGKYGMPQTDWVDTDGKIDSEVKAVAKKMIRYGETIGNKKIQKLISSEEE